MTGMPDHSPEASALPRILCCLCGEVVTNEERHDMRWCECGNVFVDGGLERPRFGVGKTGTYRILEPVPEGIELER